METRKYLNYSSQNKGPRLSLGKLFLTSIEQAAFFPIFKSTQKKNGGRGMFSVRANQLRIYQIWGSAQRSYAVAGFPMALFSQYTEA